MGWITLLAFPLPAFCVLYFFSGFNLANFLQLNRISTVPIAYGLELGIVYACLTLILLEAPVFKTIPLKMDALVKDLSINYVDAIFLSLCAGIGEELLFRVGMQYYLGIWLTSFIFVAIHGYFSIKNPKKSLYGLIVLPFILLISYGFNEFGLWFAIAAHFSYDCILFIQLIQRK